LFDVLVEDVFADKNEDESIPDDEVADQQVELELYSDFDEDENSDSQDEQQDEGLD